MLLIDPQTDTTFVNNSIFNILQSYSPSLSRDFKPRIKNALRQGKAISADVLLATRRSVVMKGSENFATHWTPLKDVQGEVKWVVLTLAAYGQD
jgi:hypothetical protein